VVSAVDDASLMAAVASGEIARRSVKDEVRQNLIAKLRAGDRPFQGVVGYDVEPSDTQGLPETLRRDAGLLRTLADGAH